LLHRNSANLRACLCQKSRAYIAGPGVAGTTTAATQAGVEGVNTTTQQNAGVGVVGIGNIGVQGKSTNGFGVTGLSGAVSIQSAGVSQYTDSLIPAD
jgi:hypothetical protein